MKAFLTTLTIAVLVSVSAPGIADSNSMRCAELLTALERPLMSQERQRIESVVLEAFTIELMNTVRLPSPAETTRDRALLGISEYCNRNRQDTIGVAVRAWIAALPRVAALETDPKASLASALPSSNAHSSVDSNYEGLFIAVSLAVLASIWGFWVMSRKLPPPLRSPAKSETDFVGHGSVPASFRVFRKKGQPETAMGALIRMTYGSVPPRKTAVLADAVQLAHQDLLAEIVDKQSVQRIAAGLDQGPMPYSTHDLAVSTALNVFKNAGGDLRTALSEIEETARIQVQNWLLERSVAPLIAKTFNDTLVKAYPGPTTQPSPSQVKSVQEQLTAEFAKAGVNFMNLHPTIHRTLLKEALMFGRIERTVEMFAELTELAHREGRNDTARAAILLKLMEKRAAVLGS